MLITLSVTLVIFFIMTFTLTFKRSWTFQLIGWGGYSAIIFSPIVSFLARKAANHATQNGRAAWGFHLSSFVLLEILSILMVIAGCIGYLIEKERTAAKRQGGAKEEKGKSE